MSWTPTTIAFVWFFASLGLAGCSDPEPLFPADYASSYQEVRDCRRSGDHDLNYIRVLVDPAALEPYRDRQEPFAAGAVVLKEEFADETCTDLVGFTVMRKEPAGTAPDAGDWSWQRVDADRQVIEIDDRRCLGCHDLCVDPLGYDLTCAMP